MDNLFLILALLAIYALPLGIAVQRRHRSVGAIAFVNIVFGWTALGWVWAMIWSLTGNVHPPVVVGAAEPGNPSFGPSGERLS